MIILIFFGFCKYIYDYYGKLFLWFMVIGIICIYKCIMVKWEVFNIKLIVLYKGVILFLEVYIYMMYWIVIMVSINVSMYFCDVML